jgi:hypothetical protein
MSRHGRRHRLVLYTLILNHWWKLTQAIGIILLALAICMGILPVPLPAYLSLHVSYFTPWIFAGAGGYALVLSLFLIAIRKSAYVQPFAHHLRLVTPFLRLNISYRRISKASSVEVQYLYRLKKLKEWQLRLLRPLAGQTAIVLDMQGWPVPRRLLSLFLSPYFFPDKGSRLALFVPKWMDFSTELESYRSTWLDSQHQPDGSSRSALLGSLSDSRR